MRVRVKVRVRVRARARARVRVRGSSGEGAFLLRSAKCMSATRPGCSKPAVLLCSCLGVG